jgi:hypothetical protein
VLWKDPYLEGAAGHLLRDASRTGDVHIAVPEVVLIECDAHYERRVKTERDRLRTAREALNKLRVAGGGDIRPQELRYREDLEAILVEAGGKVLPIPDAPHLHLVEKAAARQRPFDDNGEGYRDALVWENILALLDRSPDPGDPGGGRVEAPRITTCG